MIQSRRKELLIQFPFLVLILAYNQSNRQFLSKEFKIFKLFMWFIWKWENDLSNQIKICQISGKVCKISWDFYKNSLSTELESFNRPLICSKVALSHAWKFIECKTVNSWWNVFLLLNFTARLTSRFEFEWNRNGKIPKFPLHLTSLHADEGKHNLTFFHTSVHVIIRWIVVASVELNVVTLCLSLLVMKSENEFNIQCFFITFAQVSGISQIHFHAPREMIRSNGIFII